MLYRPCSPAGCLEPADVHWNKPFESTLLHLRGKYVREEEQTPKENLKQLRQHMLDFVGQAWNSLPEDTVAQSFRGCGISNAVHAHRKVTCMVD